MLKTHKNLRECCNWLERSQIQTLLEGNGMAVYDTESNEDLIDTLVQCVEDGDIEEQTIRDLIE
jgi:hypothetical protein